MLKIGLTGGIGSGKSTTANIFRVLGIPVFDADYEAKQLMEHDATIHKQLVSEFGKEVFLQDRLNRSYLSKLVFDDTLKLDRLNAIVHPATISAADAWMKAQDSPYVIKEAALLFESGSAVGLDYVIGVFAPVALRMQRVIERDNSSGDEVKARMNRQISDEIKMKLCDFVLTNDEQQLLTPQVVALHGVLLDKKH